MYVETNSLECTGPPLLVSQIHATVIAGRLGRGTRVRLDRRRTAVSRPRPSFDPLRRDFCNDTTARTLRVAVSASAHPAYLLVGDGAVGSEPTTVRSGGTELGRTERLASGQFHLLHFTLDGGSTGSTVDLELSAPSGAHVVNNA